MIQVILLFHPKLAVACVLIVITSRVNIARSVVGTSQMPQSYGTPYVSMSGASKGDSLASDSYVGTYSQVKRGEIAQNVQASGTVEYDTEVSLGGGRGLEADRRGGWPEITQTGSLGIWDHPVMREAPDAHAQSLSRGL